MKILSIFGTRPEAIKMCPLVAALAQAPGMRSVVCTTGQHRSMLEQVMDTFGVHSDHPLDVMQPGQSLNAMMARLLMALDPILESVRPDRVLVHGDTTTALAGALVAFQRRVPIGHVEAGLRTGDLAAPFPEEMNRRVVDSMSDLMFAPTEGASLHLLAEGLTGRIVVTGNTVIDALQHAARRIDGDAALRAELDRPFGFLHPARRLVLVTGHRRENFGEGFARICEALDTLSARREDIDIVYPVHLNPQVDGPVREALGRSPRIHLIAPQSYLPFVRLMQRAHLVLTDSGGVQEEAPALGKPVLVMRDVTERPEAVAAGTAHLVGTHPGRIVAAVDALLDDPALHHGFSRVRNPYGDGRACVRIVAALQGRPVEPFPPPSGRDAPGPVPASTEAELQCPA
ncbi:non-hydrolyzing UDP-N-acetylglucosamine 2-epimerase [Xylophilus ampelinus]|uniref:UDP-N-acetylglucosamine 2-epimerase (non-hydrolyzing) n=1 Tax=Xylophilus ampelinus TaxID=54067 RepID=A0A318SHU6_9BURK|nr:UDP-N-acetylglucosamine 2-epimerase (non-hydrolyzing) [Xylophilus ampelinus]PYE77957.1 UDP-N-acetylglucosamine 2-epimerase [Xylophilus ampelinus]